MRLAHLSDLHLTHPRGLSARDLCSKRSLGWASWALRRRSKYRPEVLELLRADLVERRPDQVVVTGDLTHLGLPAELDEAAAWLGGFGDPDGTLVVPGNHDVYRHRDWREHRGGWDAYMRGDDGSLEFPTLRERPPLALIGVSTATPSPPFFATGEVGERQTAALGRVLARAGERGLFRVVALHHPLLEGTVSWRRRLVDAERLRRTIAAAGAELVLHGHAHRTFEGSLATRSGEAAVIGARSSSSRSQNPSSRAHYHLYDVARGPAGWTLDVRVRGLDAAGTRFETVTESTREIGRPQSEEARKLEGIST